MYTYNLDNAEAKNDLKRLYTEGKYKLAHRWSHQDAQNVTSMAALNSALSPYVLSATSDRYALLCGSLISESNSKPNRLQVASHH